MIVRLLGAYSLFISFASAAAEGDIPRIRVDEASLIVVGSAPPNPPSKVILEDGCPFEGCGFGTWKASRDVQLYQEPNAQARKKATVPAGQCVEAKRGEVHTVSPGRFTFGKGSPGLCGIAKPGSTHAVFAYIGEGYYVSWFEGKWHLSSIGYAPDAKGSGWERNACGTFAPTPTNIWWVFVERDEKTMGWTNEAESFSGTSFLDLGDPDYDKGCFVKKAP